MVEFLINRNCWKFINADKFVISLQKQDYHRLLWLIRYQASYSRKMGCKASILKYLGLIIAFLLCLLEVSTTYGSYFKEVSGYGEDDKSENSLFSKAFHQCGMEESCNFVVKNILTNKFTKVKKEDELPKKKQQNIVWQKYGKCFCLERFVLFLERHLCRNCE